MCMENVFRIDWFRIDCSEGVLSLILGIENLF